MNKPLYGSHFIRGLFLNLDNMKAEVKIKRLFRRIFFEIDITDEQAAFIDELQKTVESQLEKEREKHLKLDINDPFKYMLINPMGDTFTFNPNRGIGEELNDFLSGYFNQINDES